jgi:hypothetical protein
VARPKLDVDLSSLGLVSSFTDQQASAAGLTRALRDRLIEDGALIRISRGLYRRTDIGAGDVDLIEAALRSPLATICLTSALALHELTDEIPAAVDLALPRRKWHPTGRSSHSGTRSTRKHLTSVATSSRSTPESSSAATTPNAASSMRFILADSRVPTSRSRRS